MKKAAFGGIVLAIMFVTAVPRAQIGKPAPEISSPSWFNSKALTLAELKGKVVLLEFWTFGCWNCRNVEPFIKAWHQKYAAQGLAVIAVHAPEFSHERVLANVQRYLREHAINYPVAIDNDFITWNRYNNRYWPALYLIDKRGIIRYLRVGEGGYRETEQRIVELLGEVSGGTGPAPG
jgi:thiol-disulfide isomerase/thioredoxin